MLVLTLEYVEEYAFVSSKEACDLYEMGGDMYHKDAAQHIAFAIEGIKDRGIFNFTSAKTGEIINFGDIEVTTSMNGKTGADGEYILTIKAEATFGVTTVSKMLQPISCVSVLSRTVNRYDVSIKGYRIGA